MNTCELCHEPTRNRKRVGKRNELLCGECRHWSEYYANLTPEEWRQEEEMVAAYVAEHAGEAY